MTPYRRIRLTADERRAIDAEARVVTAHRLAVMLRTHRSRIMRRERRRMVLEVARRR